MKARLLVLFLALLATGCHKKEDPPADIPHVAGAWVGSGTDDTIGYFDFSMDLQQDGTSVFGTFHTTSSFATTSGKVTIELARPAKGSTASTLASFKMEREAWSTNACAGTITLPNYAQSMSSNFLTFAYKGADCQQTGYSGGATLRKIAGTN